MARTKIVMEPDQISSLARMAATHEEIAAFFNTSVATVKYRLSRGELKEAYEKGKAQASISLKRAMFEAATQHKNVTAQIWLSKNLMGWSDKVEQKVEQSTSFVVEIPAPMTPEDWTKTFANPEVPALPSPSDNERR